MSKIYASTDNEDYLRVLRHFRKPGSMLAAILENLSDGIFITDANANVILINHAYEVISGLRKDEVLGKNMRDLEDQGVISRSATLIVLASGKPVTIAQEFKTGRRTVVTSTPVLDGSGGIVMVVTNVRDVSELHYLKQELKKRSRLTQRYQSGIEYIERQAMDDADLIARDRTTTALLGLADRIARLDTAVLLLGETGVGKERFATYIFRRSRRSGERFIKVNCAAIAEGLIESELFGYVRGSFTGANPEGKMGLFEVADNGTIFLDEVGELPLNIQVKLLRALQEQEITRVGSDASVRINVRILAATNRNLEEMVAAGTFREDLYYRLNVFPLVIPPLRERRDDIAAIARNTLDRLNKKYSQRKTFAPAALERLRDYPWPGNVRELKNIVERAFIMSDGPVIAADDLALFASGLKAARLGEGQDVDLKTLLEQTEYEYLTVAYDKYHSVREAARHLGMDPATFVRRRKKFREKFSSRNCNSVS